MWTYPALLRAGVIRINSGKAAVGVLVMAIFFVYFLFGTHVDAYVPYRNVILEAS
jgi:hypothetical protein